MRLFHTSDTHLGHQQYPRTGPDGLNARESDIQAAFMAVVDEAVRQRPDAFLHAGDLFDGVRPGNRALAAAMEGLLRLSRAGVPTVVIAGNHEHPRMRGTGSPLRIFEHLDGVHVVYRGRAESIRIDTSGGPLVVHAVPQCADQQALGQEVGALRRPDGAVSVLMVHGAVQSIAAFGNAEFNEQTLETSWFDARFDYVALGHYHTCSQVTPRAWYSGSSERVSIAEAGEPKGFLDVSVGPDQVDARHVPVPGRPYADLPMLHAAGMDANAVLETARESLARVPEGAVCRLRIEGLDPALRGVLDLRGLRAAAAHALHLDLRTSFADRPGREAGPAAIGSLWQEFQAFAGTQPIEAVDRERLMALAREVLDR